MIRIAQLKLHISYLPGDVRKAVLKKLRIKDAQLFDISVVKKSLDARDKQNLHYILTVDVKTDSDKQILSRNKSRDVTEAPDCTYQFPKPGTVPLKERPVIIGSGPSGLFAAYFLAMKGFCPIVIERGEPVEKRIEDVQRFWEEEILDPDSNIQFGEGGAGTFSDGKLNTGIHDLYGRKELVLRTFVENGAPKEILSMNKPHLGTDVLVRIVSSMRRHILEWGGEYRFRTTFLKLLHEHSEVTGIAVKSASKEEPEQIAAGIVILAIGNSAGDTYRYLIEESPLQVTAKAFAVGVRVEHLQSEINRAQYGDLPEGLLPPADYKLTFKSTRGHSVYSFCMCPGGYVVNSSSEEGRTCVNGMSYSGRSSANANAAIVSAVHPSEDPMENLRYQKELEEKTFALGKGRIVSQRLSDFEAGKVSSDFGRILPVHKGHTVMGNIREILPEDLCADIAEAIHAFGGRLEGFDDPDVILSAVETRTSAPVRIVRDEDMQALVRGVYPVGEGAGYAGGITSAAVDGIKAFEKIYTQFVFVPDDML